MCLNLSIAELSERPWDGAQRASWM